MTAALQFRFRFILEESNAKFKKSYFLMLDLKIEKTSSVFEKV